MSVTKQRTRYGRDTDGGGRGRASPAGSTPHTVTGSAEFRAAVEARVDAFRTAHRVPGVAVVVFRGNGDVVATARGVRSAADPVPLTPDTLFRLYSLTKTVTAVTVLRLWDRGLLDLDTPLGDVAPRLAEAAPGTHTRLTVRQLLSHTAGLAAGVAQIAQDSGAPEALAEETRREAAAIDVIAPPGRLYSYSNHGYALLGAAVEELTGRPYAEAVAELVAEPLGLPSLCFDPLVAMTHPLSQQHVLVDEEPSVSRWYGASARLYPAGMAFMSPADLARLGRMHLSGGLVPDTSERFLSERALTEQRGRQADIGLVEDRHYGLGLYVGPRYGDADCCGHEGYYTGTWCYLMLYPGQDLGVVWCDNRGHDTVLSAARREAIDAILQELGVPAEPRERPFVPEAPGDVTGTYTRPSTLPVRVARGEDGLCLLLGRWKMPLTHHSGAVHRITVPSPALMNLPPFTPHSGSRTPAAAFLRGADGEVSHLSVNGIVYGREPQSGEAGR